MSRVNTIKEMTYLMADIDVGETISMEVTSPVECKNVSRMASKFGMRYSKGFMCRTKDGVITVTRLR
ncbi:hypothetical protein UFOVP616_7 [uncultured Caudovirales phage]|uniref:Uncharacterized protein n=1 Tax=uncultured Caudovirales phage TaxID=2100421 RepID=A0A6J5N4S3_9CAUD|nr:hypothetical protein UFOVP616_7 [uncultured Caudovirales phage]